MLIVSWPGQDYWTGIIQINYINPSSFNIIFVILTIPFLEINRKQLIKTWQLQQY